LLIGFMDGVCCPCVWFVVLVGARVFAFFTALRASTSLPIACAGFCWGGRLVAQLCAASTRTKDGKKPLVDCGFMTHLANEAV